jgi:hypothetical protein
MLAHFPEDRYVIAQKIEHTPVNVKFRLKCAIDFQGKKLPRRLILRDHCDLDYRRHNGNAETSAVIFEYVSTTQRCPVGTSRHILLADVRFNPGNNPVLGHDGWKWYFHPEGGADWFIDGALKHTAGSGSTTPYVACNTMALPYTWYIAVVNISAISGEGIYFYLGGTEYSATISTTGWHRVPVPSGAASNPDFIIGCKNTVGVTIASCWLDVYFTSASANTTNPALDACKKDRSACLLRFNGLPLPFGGFPNVARARL